MMDTPVQPFARGRWVVWIGLVLGLSGAPASARDGATLYRDQCARCHGPEARGNGPEAAVLAHPPRNLRDGFLARYSVDDLVARVRTGRMLPLTLDPPALGRALHDIDAVTAHVRRLPSIDWGEGRRGRELYLQRCEGCHGPTGEGARAKGRGKTPRASQRRR